MSRAGIKLFLVQLSFVLVALCGISNAAMGGSAPVVSPELFRKAADTGRVRVIVQLAAPETPDSSGPENGAMIAKRRETIAAARTTLMAAFKNISHVEGRQFEHLPLTVMEVGMEGLQMLELMAGPVIKVYEDKINRISLAQSVPIIQADQVWAGGFGGTPFDGTGTVIAILDTGVDKNHSFLSGKVVEEACFSTNSAAFGASSLCPGGAESSFAAGSGLPCSASIEGCDHGTHVAGIAAGKGNSFSGVARGASIMAVKVFTRFDNFVQCGFSFDPCIAAFDSDVLAGLERVFTRRTARNFAAVNMSLGGGRFTANCDSDVRKTIVDQLKAANIATVIASGNDGFTNAISAPGCISSAVSVGSTQDGSSNGASSTTLDAVSSFSNSASFLSLLAPGEWINSSVPGNKFANFRGTSMATPHVAGAFALMKQAGPNLTVNQMLNALKNTGQPVQDTRNGITKPRIKVLDALFVLPLSDITAPAKIKDLKAATGSQTSVVLNWTTTGDDGDTGTASAFDVRFSTTKIDDSNFAVATAAAGEPPPAAAGSGQTVAVGNLFCGRTYYFAIKALDEEDNASPISNIARGRTAACNRLKTTPASLPAGEVNVAYDSGNIVVENGEAPYTIQVEPATLPPGVSFNGQKFTGTPTEAKPFTVSGTVTDAVGSLLKARFRLKFAKPVVITTTTVRAGKVNVKFNAPLRAKDGVKAYTWTLAPGSASLPSGLNLEPTGKITGTVGAPANVSVNVRVTDGAGGRDDQLLALVFN